jgi:hypothetical protein
MSRSTFRFAQGLRSPFGASGYAADCRQGWRAAFGAIFASKDSIRLITKEQRKVMLRNGRLNGERRKHGQQEIDVKPVVKLTMSGELFVWLLSEIDPRDHDSVYCLCDVGKGPIFTHVSFSLFSMLRDIRRDENFVPVQSLHHYARQARTRGRIIA